MYHNSRIIASIIYRISGCRKACRLGQFRLSVLSSFSQMICSAGRKLLYGNTSKESSRCVFEILGFVINVYKKLLPTFCDMILLPQICHRHICGGTIALYIQLKGNFFREKVSLIPFKNRFVKSVPLSADSGLRLCLKNPQAFEKAWPKLSFLLSH